MGYSARRGFTNGSMKMTGAQRQAEMQARIQQMQEQVNAAQEAVEAQEFTASVGGGVVEAKVNGKKEVLAVTIKPEAVDPEDVEMLQDLVVSAVNEALRQAGEAMDKEFHGKYDIWGGDVDPRAVAIARDNARKAGVEDVVRFEVADMRNFRREDTYGQLVTNPPYGERLLEKREAEALYRSFGKAARTLPAGWRVLVLSSHTEFERAFGRSAEKKRKLYNGMLKCDAFFYHGGAKTEPDKG